MPPVESCCGCDRPSRMVVSVAYGDFELNDCNQAYLVDQMFDFCN